MSRRRSMIEKQYEAFVARRQRQAGTDMSNGNFTSGAYAGEFPRSVEFLINFRNTQGLQYLYTEQFAAGSFAITVNNTPGACVVDYNGVAFTPLTNLGSYLHLVIILEAGKGQIYLNGSKKTELQNANFAPLDVKMVSLGDSLDAHAFKSTVMHYRRYNAALTAAEVTTLYNYGAAEELILPAALKAKCDAEYIPQNIVGAGSVASAWLDSSRQIPVNGVISPLIGPNGGRDLAANKAPKIVPGPIFLKEVGATTTGFGVDKSQDDTMEWIYS